MLSLAQAARRAGQRLAVNPAVFTRSYALEGTKGFSEKEVGDLS